MIENHEALLILFKNLIENKEYGKVEAIRMKSYYISPLIFNALSHNNFGAALLEVDKMLYQLQESKYFKKTDS